MVDQYYEFAGYRLDDSSEQARRKALETAGPGVPEMRDYSAGAWIALLGLSEVRRAAAGDKAGLPADMKMLDFRFIGILTVFTQCGAVASRTAQTYVDVLSASEVQDFSRVIQDKDFRKTVKSVFRGTLSDAEKALEEVLQAAEKRGGKRVDVVQIPMVNDARQQCESAPDLAAKVDSGVVEIVSFECVENRLDGVQEASARPVVALSVSADNCTGEAPGFTAVGPTGPASAVSTAVLANGYIPSHGAVPARRFPSAFSRAIGTLVRRIEDTVPEEDAALQPGVLGHQFGLAVEKPGKLVDPGVCALLGYSLAASGVRVGYDNPDRIMPFGIKSVEIMGHEAGYWAEIFAALGKLSAEAGERGWPINLGPFRDKAIWNVGTEGYVKGVRLRIDRAAVAVCLWEDTHNMIFTGDVSSGEPPTVEYRLYGYRLSSHHLAAMATWASLSHDARRYLGGRIYYWFGSLCPKYEVTWYRYKDGKGGRETPRVPVPLPAKKKAEAERKQQQQTGGARANTGVSIAGSAFDARKPAQKTIGPGTATVSAAGNAALKRAGTASTLKKPSGGGVPTVNTSASRGFLGGGPGTVRRQPSGGSISSSATEASMATVSPTRSGYRGPAGRTSHPLTS